MNLEYKLVRSKRRSISIEITKDAEVIVRAPILISTLRIENFLEEKQEWIIKNMNKAKEKLDAVSEKKFVTGEKYFYLGEEYNLTFISGVKERMFFSDGFFISEKYQDRAKSILIKWYKDRARMVFAERLNYYADIMNIQYLSLRLSGAKSRWGSASSTGNINLNWKLIMAPEKIIDYVVVHELAHLKHPNHSKEFWSFVESFDKNYKENRKWLKDKGHLLRV